jgi:hypothetical protein
LAEEGREGLGLPLQPRASSHPSPLRGGWIIVSAANDDPGGVKSEGRVCGPPPQLAQARKWAAELADPPRKGEG